MTRTILDFHILQTVPPSNLNRDDTGSPKTAPYGGVRRARVSSQAWKRATRQDFRDYLDERDLGTRTKRIVELVGEAIASKHPELSEEDARTAAKAVWDATGIKVKEPKKGMIPESGYLMFVSALQIDALAELAYRAFSEGDAVDKKEAQSLVKGKNSIDLALFGRMVADVSDLNVDASCQVAHALSTHPVEIEYDYFTAVDDHKQADAEEDAGAGMIGTVEFDSATLYRYATLDVDLLRKNLGDDEATKRAVEAFTKSFVRSMPTGKQNTFANRTLPEGVVVSLRDDQSVSLVGAFEKPVKTSLDDGRSVASAKNLAKHAAEVSDAYGSGPVETWVMGIGEVGEALNGTGERMSFDGLVHSVGEAVSQRLGLAGSGNADATSSWS
ncbi:MAG: type I-E CRISPR-associated protein Cas7/Cse4/CasC [Propionibacteriaceae bacterium]|nr:type I-E CRISPR-associated protein Cas7/Cse4/CasC [Propionibacteriaceae bacterium]